MKKIKCLTCGKVFKTNWGRPDLKEHDKIHASDKREKGYEEIGLC